MPLLDRVRAPVKTAIRRISPRLWDRLKGMRRAVLNRRSRSDVFTAIYERNSWRSQESVSGPGSTMVETARIRRLLPDLLSRLSVRTLLDVPCGDCGWIATVCPPGIDYIGGDIVPALVAYNQAERADLGRFEVLDLAKDKLPPADLILVRDCFIHLPNTTVKKCLRNIASSEIQWLLTTHNAALEFVQDIELGGYRPIRLDLPPFSLPRPVEIISESDDGTAHMGKSLALWSIPEIRRAVEATQSR